MIEYYKQRGNSTLAPVTISSLGCLIPKIKTSLRQKPDQNSPFPCSGSTTSSSPPGVGGLLDSSTDERLPNSNKRGEPMVSVVQETATKQAPANKRQIGFKCSAMAALQLSSSIEIERVIMTYCCSLGSGGVTRSWRVNDRAN